MDLEAPLRTIASPVEAEVLRVLAGADAEFTSPQVHRLAPSSTPFGVRKALNRLADTGLVTSHRHGSTATLQGNRAHVLWPAIEMAVNARRELLDRIHVAVAEREGLSAYLYGSFARRESSSESDIDILLVYPDAVEPESMIDFAYDLSSHIEAWTGNPGQAFNVTRSHLRDLVRRDDPIVESFRKDAVPVVGIDFGRLLRDLDGNEGGDE